MRYLRAERFQDHFVYVFVLFYIKLVEARPASCIHHVATVNMLKFSAHLLENPKKIKRIRLFEKLLGL